MANFDVKLRFDYDELKLMPLDIFRTRLIKMLYMALPRAIAVVNGVRDGSGDTVSELIQEWKGR